MLLPECPHGSHSMRYIFSLLHGEWPRVLRQTLCPLTGGRCFVLRVNRDEDQAAWPVSFWNRVMGLHPRGSLEICSSERSCGPRIPFWSAVSQGPLLASRGRPCSPWGATQFLSHRPRNFLTLIPVRLLVFPSPRVCDLSDRQSLTCV